MEEISIIYTSGNERAACRVGRAGAGGRRYSEISEGEGKEGLAFIIQGHLHRSDQMVVLYPR